VVTDRGCRSHSEVVTSIDASSHIDIKSLCAVGMTFVQLNASLVHYSYSELPEVSKFKIFYIFVVG
jgi:hypothetical protein